MAQQNAGWNLFSWWKKREGKRTDRRRALALETLEGRVVPATVINPLDSTNPSTPLFGSLRWALANTAAGGTVNFDTKTIAANFPETVDPSTGQIQITLNGAVGSLKPLQDVTIQAPLLTAGPDIGKPAVQITADTGITSLLTDSNENITTTDNGPQGDQAARNEFKPSADQKNIEIWVVAKDTINYPVGSRIKLTEKYNTDPTSAVPTYAETGRVQHGIVTSYDGTTGQLIFRAESYSIKQNYFTIANSIFESIWEVRSESSVVFGGAGYKVGDRLQQGATQYLGGAQFQVTEVNTDPTRLFTSDIKVNGTTLAKAGAPMPLGYILNLAVLNAGANSNSLLFTGDRKDNLPLTIALDNTGSQTITFPGKIEASIGQPLQLDGVGGNAGQYGTVTVYSWNSATNTSTLTYIKTGYFEVPSSSLPSHWNLVLKPVNLDQTGTDQTSISNLSGPSGKGVILGNFVPRNFGIASDLVLASNTLQILNLENLEFGQAATNGILIQSGDLSVDSCVFANPGSTQQYYINIVSSGGKLTLTNSTLTSDLVYQSAYQAANNGELTQSSTGFTQIFPVVVDGNGFEITYTINTKKNAVIPANNTQSLYVDPDLNIPEGRLIELMQAGGGQTIRATVKYYNRLTGFLYLENEKAQGTSNSSTNWDFRFVTNIVNPGKGYRPGDILQQGNADLLNGRALFRVTSVNNYEDGEITGIEVVVGGKNPKNIIGQTLSAIGTGVNQLTATLGSKGTGAVLGNFASINFGQGYFQTVTTPGTQIRFAGTGDVSVENSLFTQALNAMTVAATTATTELTVINSGFAYGKLVSEAATTTITDTWFKKALDGALELGNSSTTITNSYFADNERTTGIQINEQEIIQTPNNPRVPDYPLVPLYAYLTAQQTGGISDQVTPQYIRYGLIDASGKPVFVAPNPNRGGAAIFAWEGKRLGGIPATGSYTLDISKSVFSNNKTLGINTFNSGGGAVYSNSGTGTVTIDQTGFSENTAEISMYPSINIDGTTVDFAAEPSKMPSAANSGGSALYTGGPTTITKSYFNNNTLTSAVDFWNSDSIGGSGTPQYGGGAAYLTSNNAQTGVPVSISNTTFANNRTEAVPGPDGKRVINPYAGAAISSLKAADLNQDGLDDLVVGTSEIYENIDIRLGTYNYQNPVQYDPALANQFNQVYQRLTTGLPIVSMGIGDVNGDKLPDLIALVNEPTLTSLTRANVVVFINQGLDTPGVSNSWKGFSEGKKFYAGLNGTTLAVGDLNNDGLADIVVGLNSTTASIATATSPAPGLPLNYVFSSRLVGSNPTSLAIGRLDGDSYPDLLIGYNWQGFNAAILTNSGLQGVGGDKVWSSGARTYRLTYTWPGKSPEALDLTSVSIGNFSNTADNYLDLAVSTKDNIYSWRNNNFDFYNLVNFIGKAQPGNMDDIRQIVPVTNGGLDNKSGDDLAIVSNGGAGFGWSTPNSNGAFFNFGTLAEATAPNTEVSLGLSVTPVITMVEGQPRNNLVYGQEIIGNTFSPGKTEAGNIWIGFNSIPDGSALGNGIKFFTSTDGIPEDTPITAENNNPNATKFFVQSSMTGLNGGALIISQGVDDDVDNTTGPRDFDGSTTANLLNVTVSGNILSNPYAVGRSVAKGWPNNQSSQFYADTGGLFAYTDTDSTVQIRNTLLHSNDGIVFSNSGAPSTGLSNASVNPVPATNLITSTGYNLYNHTTGITPGTKDITSEPLAPVFDGSGMANNLGPVIGLDPFVDIGTSSTTATVPISPGGTPFTLTLSTQDLVGGELQSGNTVRLEAVASVGGPAPYLQGTVLSMVPNTPAAGTPITAITVQVTKASGYGTYSSWLVKKEDGPPDMSFVGSSGGQANILTMAINILGPARDQGLTTGVYPTPLATDARDIQRKINLSVDIGAYEAQLGTKTSLTSPSSPISAVYGTPQTLTITTAWDDNERPSTAISGIVSLVDANDTTKVYAKGLIVAASADITRGTATLTINDPAFGFLPGGSGNYLAVYSGDAQYATSQSTPFVINVSAVGTTTSLVLALGGTAPVPPDSPITFTGNVRPVGGAAIPQGTIALQYFDGANWVTLSTAPTPLEVDKSGNYSGTFSMATAGTWPIRAVFTPANPANCTSSISASQNLVVGLDSSLSLTASPNPVLRGNPVTFTVVQTFTGMSPIPSGTVRLQTLAGTPVGPPLTMIPGGISTVTYQGTFVPPNTLPLGTNPLVAVFIPSTGNRYAPEQSAPVVLTIQGLDANLTLSTNPAVSASFGAPVTLNATITSAGVPFTGGAVEFYAKTGTGVNDRVLLQSLPVFPIPGGPAVTNFTYTAPSLPGGTQAVIAVYTGDTNYSPTTISQPFTVSQAATNTSLSISGPLHVGMKLALTAQVTPAVSTPFAPSGQVEFFVDGVSLGKATLRGSTASLDYIPGTPGTKVITARYLGDTSYLTSLARTEVTVTTTIVDDFILTAPQSGSIVQVQKRNRDAFGNITVTQETVLQPFGPGYTAGFTVAKGDINGDTVVDLLFAGRTGGMVQILNGKDFSPLASFYPFGGPQGFPLSIAVGDLDNDTKGDVIVAPAGVGLPPNVVIFSGATMGQNYPQAMASFYAYAPQFKGGVSVAAGEIIGGKGDEVITAPLAGAPPHIVVFEYDAAQPAANKRFIAQQSYYAYSPLYMGGTDIATADLNADGIVEILTGASASAPHVVVIDAHTQSVKASFYANYGDRFGGGVRLATLDYNEDGKQDIITSAGPGQAPQLFVYDGPLAFEGQVLAPGFLMDSFFAYGPGDASINYYGGTFVG